jgi:hypothetical protein
MKKRLTLLLLGFIVLGMILSYAHFVTADKEKNNTHGENTSEDDENEIEKNNTHGENTSEDDENEIDDDDENETCVGLGNVCEEDVLECCKGFKCSVEDDDQNNLTDSNITANLTTKQGICIVKEHKKEKIGDEKECPEDCKCTGSVTKCWTDTAREMIVYAGNSGNVIIQVKGENFTTTLKIYKENETLIAEFNDGNKTILHPDQVREKVNEKINAKIENYKADLEDDGRYHIEAEKKSRLFMLIPVKEKMNIEIDAENGDTVKANGPWWGFLAKDDKD